MNSATIGDSENEDLKDDRPAPIDELGQDGHEEQQHPEGPVHAASELGQASRGRTVCSGNLPVSLMVLEHDRGPGRPHGLDRADLIP